MALYAPHQTLARSSALYGPVRAGACGNSLYDKFVINFVAVSIGQPSGYGALFILSRALFFYRMSHELGKNFFAVPFGNSGMIRDRHLTRPFDSWLRSGLLLRYVCWGDARRTICRLG